MSLRPTRALLILPALHIVLCLLVQRNPNGWQWFPVFIADLPFSILLTQLTFLPAFVSFAVFGTMWWYLICCGVRWIFRDDVLKKNERTLD